MVSTYLSNLPGNPDETRTHQGGVGYFVDDWSRLNRFLILGTEGGTFYVTANKLTWDSAECVVRCLNADPARTVDAIVAISDSGRAAKNEPAIFALAFAMVHSSVEARRLAAGALQSVCRTGTHLLHFCAYVNAMRGWGKVMDRAISGWYNDKSPDELAYQVTKYASRDGWSHRDVLRLCHIRPASAGHQAVFNRIVEKPGGLPDEPAIYGQIDQLRSETVVESVAKLIADHRLSREVVPTQWLAEPAVWEALLQDMPMTAMLRNLGTMASVGLLTPMSDAVKLVVDQVGDVDRLARARVHPIAILIALKTFASGHGVRSSKTWQPVAAVVDALDAAFYASFGFVSPIGKAVMLAVDTSGSMGTAFQALPITFAEAAATMAMVTARTEPNHYLLCFDTAVRSVAISPAQRLDDVMKAMQFRGSGTTCSLPPKEAWRLGIEPEALIYYTDNATADADTWPSLSALRHRTGDRMRVVSVGMAAYDYSILKNSAPWTLNVEGFDASTPDVIAGFARGEL